MTQVPHPCPLCLDDGGRVIWRNNALRIVAVDDPEYVGFTRVVWNAHVSEMTQLSPKERNHLMDAVWRVEQTQRKILRPDKINLAQFGNMVPHLHWHVIPRWAADSHFPEAIWASAPARTHAQATAWAQQRHRLLALLPEYETALVECCNATT